METTVKAQAVAWSGQTSGSECNDKSIGEKFIQRKETEFSYVQMWRHHHREFSISKDSNFEHINICLLQMEQNPLFLRCRMQTRSLVPVRGVYLCKFSAKIIVYVQCDEFWKLLGFWVFLSCCPMMTKSEIHYRHYVDTKNFNNWNWLQDYFRAM